MLNYRHSLNTINKALKKKTDGLEKIGFVMQDGKAVYTIYEKNDDYKNMIACGHYYTASDLVEYVNSKGGK